MITAICRVGSLTITSLKLTKIFAWPAAAVHIFDLHDANYGLAGGRLHRLPMGWKKFWREVEIAPLVIWRSFFFGQVFYAIFHPFLAFRELRAYVHRLRSRALA